MTPYILWAVSLAVTLALLVGVWVWGDRAQKRLRAQFEHRHQELLARTERSRQERGEVLERAEQRSERSMAVQHQLVDLAQQTVKNQQTIIELLRQLVERRT